MIKTIFHFLYLNFILIHICFAYDPSSTIVNCTNNKSDEYRSFVKELEIAPFRYIGVSLDLSDNAFEFYEQLNDEALGGFEMGNGGDAVIGKSFNQLRYVLIDFIGKRTTVSKEYSNFLGLSELNKRKIKCLQLKQDRLDRQIYVISKTSSPLAQKLIEIFNETTWRFYSELDNVDLTRKGQVELESRVYYDDQQAAIRIKNLVVINEAIYLKGVSKQNLVIKPFDNINKTGLILHELVQGLLNSQFYKTEGRDEFVREVTRSLMGNENDIFKICEKLSSKFSRLKLKCKNRS